MTLLIAVILIAAYGLPWPWYVLAVVVFAAQVVIQAKVDQAKIDNIAAKVARPR